MFLIKKTAYKISGLKYKENQILLLIDFALRLAPTTGVGLL